MPLIVNDKCEDCIHSNICRIKDDRLKAIHLNDSKNTFASHKDRHEIIGGGSLGIEAITRIINHPLLREIPLQQILVPHPAALPVIHLSDQLHQNLY